MILVCNADNQGIASAKRTIIDGYFDLMLEACGVEYFDFLLLHAQHRGNYDKYKKAKEYLLSLDDDELNKIAHEFVKVDVDEISPRTLIKLLIKVSPKALLKLGKLF